MAFLTDVTGVIRDRRHDTSTRFVPATAASRLGTERVSAAFELVNMALLAALPTVAMLWAFGVIQ